MEHPLLRHLSDSQSLSFSTNWVVKLEFIHSNVEDWKSNPQKGQTLEIDWMISTLPVSTYSYLPISDCQHVRLFTGREQVTMHFAE